MSDTSIFAEELKQFVKDAEWVVFTEELQKQFQFFAVDHENTQYFADHDGLYMVSLGEFSIQYLSHNGHYHGVVILPDTDQSIERD